MDAVSRSRGSRLPYDGVGFAFLPGDGLIGIDLDNMLDPETGELNERALAIVKACASYTEWSPSKKGLHIICKGANPRGTNKSDKIGVEVFSGAQYFTFTGEHYGSAPTEVTEISELALRRLHATVDEAKGKRPAKAKAPQAGQPGDAPQAGQGQAASNLDNDFKRVNDAAMRSFDAWVPALFPAAKRVAKGYRVASAALGRELEEDLTFHEEGIKDFGVHDLGDPREGRRTPIDVVIEWSAHKKPAEALHWLAGKLGMTLAKPARGRAGARGGAGGPPPEDDEPPGDGRPLPVIKWKQGFLRHCVDEGEAALMASEARIYQRSGMLVRVVRRDSAIARNYKRDPGILGFQVVDQPYLVEAFTDAARWEKWDGRAEAWRRINAPEQAAATYLSRIGRWRLPKLWSVISAPTLRPDGTVLQNPGYDEETATWYDPGQVKFPAIPEEPTLEDARAALKLLRDAFKTFPFVTPADESVLLSAVLTSLVRRSVPHAPLVGFSAPTSSSGKTLLADLISIIAVGVRAPAMKYPETDEEAAKLALAALMEGDPIILIDNVDRPLGGDWLCTILTSETYRQRMLGRSEMVSVPSSSLWLATGNNLVLFGDLRTRSLVCKIDAKVEHPEQRAFPEEIKDTLARRRPELVAAGLTVMRAFIATDQRVAEFVKPWGRFEQWTEMVRAPLVWLDMEDPCLTIAEIENEDPERGELLRVLTTWRASFGIEERTASAAIKRARDGVEGLRSDTDRALEEVLRDICRDRAGALDAKRLGKWLSRHVARRVEGMALVKGAPIDHSHTYKVEVLAKNN